MPTIVTLTTDFGTRDGYAGAMKGVILSRAPDALIVDITHEIPAHDIAAGAYALATAVGMFPRGTVHVAVVDPGVGGARRPIVASLGGQTVVGPDNGLFDLLALGPLRAYEITSDKFRRPSVCATFHGRDLFAAAAGALAAGLLPPMAGPECDLEHHLSLEHERNLIVHVDVFGNLISNLRADDMGPGDLAVINGHPPVPFAETYSSVPVGELLAYVGSASTLEIAVREGSAAERLGVGRGTHVNLKRASND